MPSQPVEPTSGSPSSSSSGFLPALGFAQFSRSGSNQGTAPSTTSKRSKRNSKGGSIAPPAAAPPPPPPAQDTPPHRDRNLARYSNVPASAQLLDPTGMTRIQPMPRKRIGTFEGWRIWYSGVTVGSMFEQWEVIFVHSVVLGLFILLGCALAYFPPHVAHVVERARYYLSGSDL